MADDIKPSTPSKGGTMKSALFPIASKSITFDKGYLLAAIATAIATVVLFAAAQAGERILFATTLAYYITFVQCAVIYYFCGRRELWPSMIGVFVFSYVALYMTPLFGSIAGPFRGPQVEALMKGSNMASQFIGHSVGAGALEELFKALPLLGLALLGLMCKSGAAPAHLRAISLTEPLDGIALGVASGAAFAVVETLYQYYPLALTASNSWAFGLEILIARGISQIGGHMAWAGYLGYFIGLAVLRPKAAPLYLAVGYVTAAALHGAANATSGQGALKIIVLAVSIAFLISAILKARRISPTRSQNFATVAFSTAGVAPAPAPVAAAPRRRPFAGPLAAVEVDAPRKEIMPEKASQRAAGTLVLKIGSYRCVLAAGAKIEPRMLGSAGAGRGRGPIAEVVGDASGFGLKNLGEKPWRARSPQGQTVEVTYGQIAPLAKGTVIDFVGIEGAVTSE